jgi:Tfp pilus assembly protein FimT
VSIEAKARRRRRWRDDDAGFTLLEVISTCILATILLGIAVGPFKEYQRKSEHQGTVRSIVSALRHAQVASVSEGVSYRVDTAANGKSLTVTRMGTPATVVRTVHVSNTSITIENPQFVVPAGPPERATFYPRGSATPGTIDVSRDDRDKTYRITLEGLTARVSYDE